MGGSFLELASQRRFLGALVIAGSIALLVGACLGVGLLGPAQAALSDLFFPSDGGDSGTVVVGVDARAVKELGEWPWPRVLQAELVDAIASAGARLIVLDAIYDRDREGDDALVAAMRKAENVITAVVVSPKLRERGIPVAGRTVVAPVPKIADASFAQGFADVQPDGDKVVRSAALVVEHERGRLFPSLAYAAFSVIEGQDVGATTVRPKGFQVADRLIPTDRRKLLRVNYSRRFASAESPGHVSAADVLMGTANDELRGKVVFVGVTDLLGGDLEKTPVAAESPGVLIHANALSTLRQRSYVTTLPWWLTVACAALLSFLIAAAGLGRRLWLVAVAAVVSIAVYVVVADSALDWAGREMNLVWPSIAAALSGVSTVGLRSLADRLRRREAEQTLEAVKKSSVPDREQIKRLANFAELKDDDTGKHIDRVGAYSKRLAVAAGLSEEEAQDIELASVLHDCGKIGVDDAVLRKPGKLTDVEFDLMRRHPNDGYTRLVDTENPLVRLAADIAHNHHERWDGSGYPNRRRGEEIPLEARIVAIADVFDALTSKRPYKDPWPPDKALEEIVRCGGAHFDPELVEKFQEVFPDIVRLREELMG